jgi:hypothetical protein
MNINNLTGEVDERSDTTEGVGLGRLLIGAFFLIALPALILFGSSGRLDWGMAWLYVGLTTAFSLGSRIILQWKFPQYWSIDSFRLLFASSEIGGTLSCHQVLTALFVIRVMLEL